VALDSTVLFAKGGVWHKKDREAGIVPHSSIDTQAGWTKSGWHGWAYGWKLHLATTVGSVWIPLAAYLTPANFSDNRVALSLVEQLPKRTRFVLGDTHYDAPEVRAECLGRGKYLVASGRGPYPAQWYRSHFLTSSQKYGRKILTGESSPYYIYHPHAAKRVAKVVPSPGVCKPRPGRFPSTSRLGRVGAQAVSPARMRPNPGVLQHGARGSRLLSLSHRPAPL
jgi:hypothetical protein